MAVQRIKIIFRISFRTLTELNLICIELYVILSINRTSLFSTAIKVNVDINFGF